MVKRLMWMVLLCLPVTGFAAGAGIPLMSANNDLDDKASLQRGATLFVNYCLSCHSAKYMRYSRMGEDLAISEELGIPLRTVWREWKRMADAQG